MHSRSLNEGSFRIKVRRTPNDTRADSSPVHAPKFILFLNTMSVTAKAGPPRKICMQLPNLLAICGSFELQVNRHCKLVSQASEQWLADSGIALPSMKWSAVKVGLLAAACYPDADPPQLRLMTDVISLVFHQYDLTGPSSSSEVAQRPVPIVEDIFSMISARLSHAAYQNPGWYMRLHKSQRLFLDARHCRTILTFGDPEAYLITRRAESGFLVAIDMVEYARDLILPQHIVENEFLQRLREYACDIAVLSEDVVSCAKGITLDDQNVINVVRRAEGASIESALAITGALVRERVGAFEGAERSLLGSLAIQSAAGDDVQSYVRALRNWIAGFVNWLYESERYLEEKGSEINSKHENCRRQLPITVTLMALVDCNILTVMAALQRRTYAGYVLSHIAVLTQRARSPVVLEMICIHDSVCEKKIRCNSARPVTNQLCNSPTETSLALHLSRRRSPPYPLPPGPKPHLILGNLRDLSTEELWIKAHTWAKLYGRITYLRVFSQSLVFLNTPKAVFDLLDRRGSIYSDRLHLVMAKELCGCDTMVAFTPYNETFRRQRRLFQMALGSSSVQAFHPRLELEMRPFLRRLLADPSDYSNHIRRYIGSVTLLIVYGHQVKSNDDPFLNLAEECVDLLANKIASSGGLWAVDILPFLKYLPTWFPGASFKRNAALWKAKIQEFVDKPYEYVLEEIRKGTARPCFVSMLLDSETSGNTTDSDSKHEDASGKGVRTKNYHGVGTDALRDQELRWTANSMYAGGIDTSLTLLSHFILAMVRYPDVCTRAQSELDTIVGQERLPRWEDRSRLPYCEALFKEVFRWAAPVPLGLPHRVTEDDVYDGMFIPKGSLVFGNIWAILRDETLYPNPDSFDPTRFLSFDSSGAFVTEKPPATEKDQERRRDPRLYVFGFGRRRCPGAHLVESSLWLLIVSMLTTLDISKSTGSDGVGIEPEVVFENSVFRIPNPFKCSIRPRSDQALQVLMEVEDSLH